MLYLCLFCVYNFIIDKKKNLINIQNFKFLVTIDEKLTQSRELVQNYIRNEVTTTGDKILQMVTSEIRVNFVYGDISM